MIAVCRGVAFAHERGILHLDLKPENVMLGEYGEVYVVDWGLAAGHGPDAPGWLPAAASIRGIAGTPTYMAPELAAADARRIGVATDVYLLGGMLHTIATGEPLHAGGDVMQLLLAAYRAEPKPIPGAPAELVAIVHRATARAPEDRFESVDALREALEAFLRHRLADRLATVAEGLRAELAALVDASAPASDVEVEPKLAELEQAIAQIRAQRADHPALEGLSEALLDLRAGHALAHERPDAAAAFLDRMARPPARRRARLEAVRAALAERAARRGKLEAMSRELDFTLGSATRRRLFAVLSTVWLVVSLGLGFATRSGLFVIGYRELLVEGALITAGLLPVGWLRRDTLFQNRANRRLYGGLIFTALAVELHWVACLLLGVPVMTAVGLTGLHYTYAFTTMAFVLDRRLGWGALALGLTSIAASLAPAWAYDILGVGGFTATMAILAAWRRA